MGRGEGRGYGRGEERGGDRGGERGGDGMGVNIKMQIGGGTFNYTDTVVTVMPCLSKTILLP